MKIHCININCIISIEVDIDVQIVEIDKFDIFIELDFDVCSEAIDGKVFSYTSLS